MSRPTICQECKFDYPEPGLILPVCVTLMTRAPEDIIRNEFQYLCGICAVHEIRRVLKDESFEFTGREAKAIYRHCQELRAAVIPEPLPDLGGEGG